MNINQMYQYSLAWFVGHLKSAIDNTDKVDDVQQRIKDLKKFFTYFIYTKLCRSLQEKVSTLSLVHVLICSFKQTFHYRILVAHRKRLCFPHYWQKISASLKNLQRPRNGSFSLPVTPELRATLLIMTEKVNLLGFRRKHG